MWTSALNSCKRSIFNNKNKYLNTSLCLFTASKHGYKRGLFNTKSNYELDKRTERSLRSWNLKQNTLFWQNSISLWNLVYQHGEKLHIYRPKCPLVMLMMGLLKLLHDRFYNVRGIDHSNHIRIILVSSAFYSRDLATQKQLWYPFQLKKWIKWGSWKVIKWAQAYSRVVLITVFWAWSCRLVLCLFFIIIHCCSLFFRLLKC